MEDYKKAKEDFDKKYKEYRSILEEIESEPNRGNDVKRSRNKHSYKKRNNEERARIPSEVMVELRKDRLELENWRLQNETVLCKICKVSYFHADGSLNNGLQVELKRFSEKYVEFPPEIVKNYVLIVQKKIVDKLRQQDTKISSDISSLMNVPFEEGEEMLDLWNSKGRELTDHYFESELKQKILDEQKEYEAFSKTVEQELDSLVSQDEYLSNYINVPKPVTPDDKGGDEEAAFEENKKLYETHLKKHIYYGGDDADESIEDEIVKRTKKLAKDHSFISANELKLWICAKQEEGLEKLT